MMKVFIRRCCFMIFLFYFPTILYANDLPLIYPGKGIGNIHIGDTLDSIIMKWDKADEIKKYQTRKADNSIYLEYRILYFKELFLFIIDINKKLKGILTKTQSVFVNNTSIGIGSSFGTVKKNYQKYEIEIYAIDSNGIINDQQKPEIRVELEKADVDKIMLVPRSGIAFSFLNNIVVTIGVFMPMDVKNLKKNLKTLGALRSWNKLLTFQ